MEVGGVVFRVEPGRGGEGLDPGSRRKKDRYQR